MAKGMTKTPAMKKPVSTPKINPVKKTTGKNGSMVVKKKTNSKYC